jgi:hypothetical protein
VNWDIAALVNSSSRPKDIEVIKYVYPGNILQSNCLGFYSFGGASGGTVQVCGYLAAAGCKAPAKAMLGAKRDISLALKDAACSGE